MSKKIFKYENNGSDSHKKGLEDFLNESQASENLFDYSVVASDQSASGIVGRINEGEASASDEEIYNKWQDQYNACGGCPCDGMSDKTCGMFDGLANSPPPDECPTAPDCQGVCGGSATTDSMGNCCLEADISEVDGLCHGCEDCVCACPDNNVAFDSRVGCQPVDSCRFGCGSGGYPSMEACMEAHGEFA